MRTEKMKKSKRKVVSIAAILIFLVALLPISYLLVNGYETGKMTPEETQKIEDNIFIIRNDYVNFYLIKNNEGYIAIDAGLNKEKTEEELKKLAINPKDVKAVFLTHTDYDHKACLQLFDSAAIYISEEEVQMVNGITYREFIFKNSLDRPYKTMKDQDKVMYGDREIKGIMTPGHTPGSMSYLIDGKYLFTGDTFSLVNKKAELFNKFFNMDSNLQEESIHKLANEKISKLEFIFTGHYGYSKDLQNIFKDW